MVNSIPAPINWPKERTESLNSSREGPILVTGASGLLGGALYRALSARSADVTGLSGRSTRCGAPECESSLDLADGDGLHRTLDTVSPVLVFNCAAMPDIGPCEEDRQGARAVNSSAPAIMAAWCRARRARLIHFSTDQVFDGTGRYYREGDPPAPVHHYGVTKADGERAVLAADPGAVVARLSLIYGVSPSGHRSASEGLVNAIVERRPLHLYTNEFRTPVLVDDLVRAALFLAESDFSGLIHLAGPERLDRYEFGLEVAKRFDLDTAILSPALSDGLDASPPRPLDLSLDTALADRILPFPLKNVAEGLAELPDL